MQPYFFPYLGYFQLINIVDQFILLDEVQYIRHGWINRNRILKPDAGVQYIIAPLSKHHRATLIKDIAVQDGSAWKEKIIRQLAHYKTKAPFYNTVIGLLEECFANDDSKIASLNAFYLKKICNYIGIQTSLILSSSLNYNYNDVSEKDDWALSICKKLNANTYINPLGGVALFDKDKYQKNSIQLSFLNPGLPTYSQSKNKFEPGLSIIDIMMFNSTNDIRLMLNDFELI